MTQGLSPLVDAHAIEGKESELGAMENHQFTKGGSNAGKRELPNIRKTMNKTGTLSPYLSTITLHGNGSNYSIKRHSVAYWVDKTQRSVPPAEDSRVGGNVSGCSQCGKKYGGSSQSQK